jgi:hypothetical protein
MKQAELNQTKSSRGGKRANAGRPPGACNVRTREIADQAIATGLSPLEVMLAAMRVWIEAGDYKSAVTVAAMAAPYVHPRLATVSIQPKARLDESICVKWLDDDADSGR